MSGLDVKDNLVPNVLNIQQRKIGPGLGSFLVLDRFLYREKWYFVTKIVMTYCEKICSSDREKLLELKAKSREFAKILRSLKVN